jgi:hypothetical protein
VAYAEALAAIHRKKREVKFNNDILEILINSGKTGIASFV